MTWKYPRTPYIHEIGVKHLIGRRCVITEKMDGENTSIHGDGRVHARSLISVSHPSRDWVKAFAANLCIPVTYRICGENVYARHSIGYTRLSSFFQAFSVWEDDVCFSWDDTISVLENVGVRHVPVLFDDVLSTTLIDTIHRSIDTKTMEGYVIRLADSFRLADFQVSVVKWVRPGHVQTDDHWMYQPVVRNSMQKEW